MQVKELIALLAEMDPEADFVLFRDVPSQEDDPEVEEIQLTTNDVVLAETYAGIQIPNK